MNDSAPRKRFALILIGFGLAAAAMAAGVSFGLMANRLPPLEAATLYPEPRELAGFRLIDGAGEEFGIERWHGNWRLVFFGFTHCPDICPSTLALLRQVEAGLGEDASIAVTFVSVDPERDKPTEVERYAQYFSKNFEGVTGSAPQLTALSRQLGLVYHIAKHEAGDANYLVDHSSAVILIDPDARLRGAFTAPHDAESMIRDLRILLDRA